MGSEFSSDTARMVIRDRLVADECGGVYIEGKWLDIFIGLILDLGEFRMLVEVFAGSSSEMTGEFTAALSRRSSKFVLPLFCQELK